MLAVFCVWSGSEKFGIEYPERLRAMLRTHLTVPAKFYSISKSPVPGWEHIPTDDIGQREGCWHKLELFKPGIVPHGTTCLFFDLDVVIVGNIDHLPTSAVFRGMTDPRPWTMNSSTMSWIAGPATDHVWHEWKRVQPEGKPDWWITGYKGDQDFIQDKIHPHWEPMPSVWGFKAHGEPPADTRVWVFYGRPKMSDLKADHPLRRAWENGGVRSR